MSLIRRAAGDVEDHLKVLEHFSKKKHVTLKGIEKKKRRIGKKTRQSDIYQSYLIIQNTNISSIRFCHHRTKSECIYIALTLVICVQIKR